MKKIFSILFIIGYSIISYSQCVSGNTNITIGQTVNFSSLVGAQCTSCYDWDINGNTTSSDNSIVGNLQIIGSDMNQMVSIKGLALGTSSLQLTYFDETGCHNCSTVITVIPVGANCTAPDIDGWFECQSSATGGQIIIAAATTFDWNKILKITIELNGATFVASPFSGLTFATFNGPFVNGFAKSVYSPGCAYRKSFGAVVTFYFKNGCPIVQKVGNYFDQGTPQLLAKNNQIIVSPNPTNSIIKFEGLELTKYSISIYDNIGNEIIKNSKIDSEINIEKNQKGIYFYKIKDENGYIQEGKIIKE